LPPPESAEAYVTTASGDKNCSDFQSQAAADAALRADPFDPWGLDRDGDAIACESDRAPMSLVPMRRR
jgi:hypothetical protein